MSSKPPTTCREDSPRTSRRRFAIGLVAACVVPPALGPRSGLAAPLRPDAGGASASALDVMLARVSQARATLQTLVGPFTQERTIGLLASKVTSRGELTLVRPDRLRWELFSPDDVVYFLGPEGLAYRTRNGGGQVPKVTPKLAAALEDLRTVLGGDIGELRQRYDLELESGAADEPTFRATPRTGQRDLRLQSVTFTLAADLVRPKRATLVESARDRTEIVFGDLTKNAQVDASRMRP
jgi:outer membrane lipoprotein-sorting protein